MTRQRVLGNYVEIRKHNSATLFIDKIIYRHLAATRESPRLVLRIGLMHAGTHTLIQLHTQVVLCAAVSSTC